MSNEDKPKLGVNRGNAGKGRPKGVPNKTARAAKEVIAQAAQEIGGADRLVAWIKEDEKNERMFWGQVYPKLLPIQVGNEEGSEGFKVMHTIQLVGQ